MYPENYSSMNTETFTFLGFFLTASNSSTKLISFTYHGLLFERKNSKETVFHVFMIEFREKSESRRGMNEKIVTLLITYTLVLSFDQ